MSAESRSAEERGHGQTHPSQPGPRVRPVGGYSQGVETRGARHLFVSGQIPEDASGRVPEGFEAQCELAWANLLELLKSAGMGAADLVKVTTFLTHPDQARVNSEVRRRVPGAARPSLTVMVAQTLDSPWLLEIEAVAKA